MFVFGSSTDSDFTAECCRYSKTRLEGHVRDHVLNAYRACRRSQIDKCPLLLGLKDWPAGYNKWHQAYLDDLEEEIEIVSEFDGMAELVAALVELASGHKILPLFLASLGH